MNNKTLVSLSCHIIISLNDCWSCTVCCRCYQLGSQISAAALYTALNHGPIQCNVEAACVFTMFMHLLIYLPPLLRVLLGCYDYYTHTTAGQSVLALSPLTYLVSLTTAYL